VLVLNRRPGESIYVEGGIDIAVLRSTHQAVWLRIAGETISPAVLLGATALSAEELCLEVGAPLRAWVDDHEVRVEVASRGQLSVERHATFSFYCRPGQVAKVGEGLELGVAPTERGHPCVTLGGKAIGVQLRLALIRLARSCVRLGIDAPGLRVYRRELWEALIAANTAAAGTDVDAPGVDARVIRPHGDDAPLRAAF
jgi:sRNA-binding carbon storage regulator CsrA